MQKIISAIVFLFFLTQAFGQAQRKVTTYLLAQFSNTIYDRTLGNNPWGVVPGLQSLLNNKTKFKQTIELTADIYLEDDKVYRTNIDGTEIPDVGGMINLLLGHRISRIKIFIYLL